MKATITARGQTLRPVGTYAEAPDGYNGRTHSGQLLTGPDGAFWARGINEQGRQFLFPVSDHWAACHCTSIGTAPELREGA